MVPLGVGKRFLATGIRVQYPDVNVYVFRGWPPGMDMFQSQDFLEKSTGASQDVLFTESRHVIIINDAHSSYYDDALWGYFLKACSHQVAP